MSAAAKIGRKAIRIANHIVNIVVLIAVLLSLLFGCYAVWDTRQVHDAADAARYGIYKPGAGSALSFQELQAINPEVFAWLNVYGTRINYPVTQSRNNIKYVSTDAKGKYSISGAIFLDYRSSPDFSDFNSILYGHHMEKQTLFGEIGLFSDKNYFDARRYGMLYYGGEEHGLEFFAFVHADAYDESVFQIKITEPARRQAYLNMLLQMALHTREDVLITADDRIVLLSTCSASSTNGRDIMIGKITGEIYGDPFKTEKTDGSSDMDERPGTSAFPHHADIHIAALMLPLILLAIFLMDRRKRGKCGAKGSGDE